MKKFTHIILTAFLLLTTIPTFAGDKNVDRSKDQTKFVRVGGQVTRPGLIEYRDNTTIFSMIVAAGGPTEFGTLKRVKVVREGKQVQLDLTKASLKNQEIAKPDDYIEAPQKNIFGR